MNDRMRGRCALLVGSRGALLASLLAFAALSSIAWSLATPPGGGPDEVNHYAVAKFIAEERRIPEFGIDPGMGVTIWDVEGGRQAVYSYSAHPGLGYILAAALISLPTDTEWMDYRQARGWNAGWYALFVLFTWLGMRRMFPREAPVAFVAATIAVAWPQISFTMGFFNGEAITLPVAAGLFWAWWRAAREHWRARDAALLGLFVGLVMLVKPNALVLLLPTLLMVALTLRGPVRTVASRLGILIVAAMLTAGWWYANALRMYGFDVFATNRAARFLEEHDLPARLTRADQGHSLWSLVLQDGWFESIMLSFTGQLGWATYHLPTRHFLWIFAIVAIGAGASLSRLLDSPIPGRGRLWWLAGLTYATAALGLVTILLHNHYSAYEPQGRYLYPFFFPFVALVASGLWFLPRTSRGRRGLMVVACLGMVGINVHALLRVLMPGTGLGFDEYAGRWQSGLLWAWSVAALILLMQLLLYWLGRSGGYSAWIAREARD